MSFDSTAVIEARHLSKTYQLFSTPAHRLKHMLFESSQSARKNFSALDGVSFSLHRGEVLGLVGRNGAGKSTLLQLICGTLQLTSGQLHIHGRVAALLELGAGFNPDFSGRENVYLNGTVLGLTREEIDHRFEAIVGFSGIGDFIDQPVKTYSSGMYMRLAFAIATSVRPDILVIDEALSVGDGEFARKSFDRIMEMKASGTTILFCSHSLFQIESLCTQAIWLNAGKIVAQGAPAKVVSAYQEFLDSGAETLSPISPPSAVIEPLPSAPKGYARLLSVRVGGLPVGAGPLYLHTLKDDLTIHADFASDPALPCPSFAVTLHTADGRIVASAGAWNDGLELTRDARGLGSVQLNFPRLALLKGRYYVSVHLFCERGIHTYDIAERVMHFVMEQKGVEQGIAHLPHDWLAHASLTANAAHVSGKLDWKHPATSVDWLSSQTRLMKAGDQLTPPEAPKGLQPMAARFGLVEKEAGTWQMTRQPRWRLDWIRTQNVPNHWFDLFQLCFGHAMSRQQFQWKYAATELAGMGVYSGERLVAFYGGSPRAVMMQGHSVLAAQIGDVMVHPEERGVMSRHGPFWLACASFLEQMMGHDRPYALGFGFPNAKAMRLGERLRTYQAVDQMVEMNWAIPTLRPDAFARAALLSSVDEFAVNTCWAAMLQSMPSSVLTVKNWAFVENRYLQHPSLRYITYLVRKRISGAPLGVVVLRETGDHDVELLDVIGSASVFTTLVRVALRHAHLKGRRRLFSWITQSHQQLLQVWRAQATAIDVWIPANAWTKGLTPDQLHNKWWLMGGDTDFK
jgi:ABC-type polysaccharide/polyol phosphate transport system ATPase subunit